MAGSAAALGQWPPSLRSPRAQRSGRTLPGEPRSAPPGPGQSEGRPCRGFRRHSGAAGLLAQGPRGTKTGWKNANTVGGRGEKKDREREKLKDFNTNNLQGVFCKQNGGQGARSTCLSALTLIVWGRRGKRTPRLAARVLVVCPCPVAGEAVGDAWQWWVMPGTGGCCSKASSRTQTCRVPAPQLLCLPLPLHSWVMPEDPNAY